MTKMKLDPQTEDLTAYLRSMALAYTGTDAPGYVAMSFGKAAVRSAQRDGHIAELEAELAIYRHAMTFLQLDEYLEPEEALRLARTNEVAIRRRAVEEGSTDEQAE